MIGFLRLFSVLFLRSRASLAAENLALRHQLGVLSRSAKRPRLRARDRVLWVWLFRLWSGWRFSLIIVQPETVVRWHRQGFRLYWRWMSRPRNPGRPRVDAEIRELIRQMSQENPLWGSPRIRDELALLGINVSKSTVEKYMVKTDTPRSQSWKTFLDNHIPDLTAIDFFTVPTVTFRVLYCFFVLRLERRLVVHFNVTANPTAAWTAQQLVEAFPYDEAPRFLIRDRDRAYGDVVPVRIHGLGIEEVLIAPHSPWQNPFAERLIGSIRRECLDHVIVFNEAHLLRVLSDYLEYYHESRAHQSLKGNSPVPREIQPPERGQIVSTPVLGGLHHRYRRAA
ncbi:MAG: integrase core domain-containing protein [Planctomycetota bacterium]|jgi:transposase InsO family protein